MWYLSQRRVRVRSVLTALKQVVFGLGIIGSFGSYSISKHLQAMPGSPAETAVLSAVSPPVAEQVSSVHPPGFEPAPQRVLAVPYLRQQFRQSCEAASLRMALQYYGQDMSDWDLLQLFGYDGIKRDMKNNTWGDPYKQFVGDVTGGQDTGEGYGVYATAVAKIGPAIGRNLLPLYEVSAQDIARAIYDGYPVIMWGYWNEESIHDSWKTPEGKTIPAVIKAHVRLIYGVKGAVDAPEGFFVHDPLIPDVSKELWPTRVVMSHLKKFGAATDQVVIVR